MQWNPGPTESRGLPVTGTCKWDQELRHDALADIAEASWWTKGSALSQNLGRHDQRPLCFRVSNGWEAHFGWRTKPFLKKGCLDWCMSWRSVLQQSEINLREGIFRSTSCLPNTSDWFYGGSRVRLMQGGCGNWTINALIFSVSDQKTGALAEMWLLLCCFVLTKES